jgi:hypothetical protein
MLGQIKIKLERGSKMKGYKGGILWLALSAVIAIGAVVPGSQAGPSNVGRFKLPFSMQMGTTALAAGDYTISIDRSVGSYGEIFVHQGSEAVATAVPQMLDLHQGQGEKPALLCIRHDGKVTVRALRLPNVGTFYFSIPKELKTLVAQQPQLIQTVAVQIGG